MGNTQNHSAEFNFFTDPEAAHIVLDGWPGVQLLPWETAVEHTAPQQQVEALMAIAAAIEPGFVLRREARHAQVELAGVITRGQSTVDWYGQSGQQANVSLILDVDQARFLELLQAALA